MDLHHYVLDENKQVVRATLDEWAKFFENREARRVARTELPGHVVSTVFLGLDHQFGDGPPLLFETMVFPEDSSGEVDMDRYSTWEEAEKGHRRMVWKWRGGEVIQGGAA